MNLTPKRRRHLYDVAIAAVLLAVLYGVIEADKADAWLLLIAATLGVARSNVNDE